jgi:predicted nucleotidyltransferase
LERVIEKRRELRERVIEAAKKFAHCVSVELGDIVAILYGSYARGDFNERSDIDVLIVTRRTLPQNPLKRLDLIEECLAKTPSIEPVVLTLDEFKVLLRRNSPLILGAIREGVLLIGDLQTLLREYSSIRKTSSTSLRVVVRSFP